MLWLWLWPAAIAPIQPLGWEPPYATCAALKRPKGRKKKKQNFKDFLRAKGEKSSKRKFRDYSTFESFVNNGKDCKRKPKNFKP